MAMGRPVSSSIGGYSRLRQGSNFLYSLFKAGNAIFYLRTRLRFIETLLHIEPIESHFHGDQILADAVVKFSSQPAAFVFLRLENAAGEFAQLFFCLLSLG